MSWYEITRWYAYRRIEHPSMRFYNITFPAAFASGLTTLIMLAPVSIALTDVLQAIVHATGLLPGFYIAALAAVSTFSGSHMDEVMPEPAPEIYIKTLQTDGRDKLTRRMFLCYLFGYLAVASLFLLFLSIALELAIPSVKSVIVGLLPTGYVPTLISIGKTLLLLGLFGALGSILITSLQGIYYLMERIFQPN